MTIKQEIEAQAWRHLQKPSDQNWGSFIFKTNGHELEICCNRHGWWVESVSYSNGKHHYGDICSCSRRKGVLVGVSLVNYWE